jgi:membrane-associated protein
MDQYLDFFLHLQDHLETFVSLYGPWVYALLFLIVFCETGLVITPFLPGDSLLFTAGALAATGILDIRLTAVLLLVAAILGDAVNYSIGHFLGPRVFRADDRSSFWHRLPRSFPSLPAADQ